MMRKRRRGVARITYSAPTRQKRAQQLGVENHQIHNVLWRLSGERQLPTRPHFCWALRDVPNPEILSFALHAGKNDNEFRVGNIAQSPAKMRASGQLSFPAEAP